MTYFHQHKLLKGSQNNNNMDVGKDRISELADPLLLHILSFLPTKYAVRTSALSKGWRNVWRCIQVLDFREWQSDTGNVSVKLQAVRVKNFLDKMMSQNDDRGSGVIQKFYLNAGYPFDESRVMAWISTLVRRKVEEIVLFLEQYHNLPSCLFTCQSLTKLDLKVYTTLESISFPRLKILRLMYTSFVDENLTQQFFSNCPVLEELSLGFCSWSDMNGVSISAPTLKCFSIWGPSLDNQNDLDNRVVRIYAPNLQSFEYVKCVAKGYVLSSFLTLVDANIDFTSIIHEEARAYGPIKLLGGVSNTKHLKLSVSTLKALNFADGLLTKLLTFYNLVRLEVTSGFPCSTSSRTLLDFLHISPNLESLIFAQGFCEFGFLRDDVDDWTLDLVPQCLLLSLKSVEFQDFYGDPRELSAVKLFLKNARILQRMTIISCSSSKREKLAITEQLLMFPRGSTSCVVKFS